MNVISLLIDTISMNEVKVKVVKREIKTGIVSSKCRLQRVATKCTIFFLRYLYYDRVLFHDSVHRETLSGKKCPIKCKKLN